MSDKAHASLSPSSFKRLMECPGSYYLTKDMPNLPTSKHAEEGTRVHEIIEKSFKDWKEFEVTGDSNLYDFSWIESDEEKECVQGYFNFVFALENKFKALCDKREVNQVKRFIEKKIELSKNIWGTCDYALAGIRQGKLEILVVDYKHGRGVKVSAFENPQTIIYGLGIEKELLGVADKIRCYIYQPRVNRENPYSSFVLEKTDIDTWKKTIKDTEDLILSINKDTVTSYLKAGDHCRWCKGQATCPERNKTALDLLTPLVKIKNTLELPVIPLEKIANIFKAKKQIEHFLDAVEAYLTRLAESGVTIPDLKLVQSRGKRSWAFKGKELENKLLEICKEKSVDVDSIYKEPAVINMFDAEKLFGKDAISDLVLAPAIRNQLVSVDDERAENIIINLIEEII